MRKHSPVLTQTFLQIHSKQRFRLTIYMYIRSLLSKTCSIGIVFGKFNQIYPCTWAFPQYHQYSLNCDVTLVDWTLPPTPRKWRTCWTWRRPYQPKQHLSFSAYLNITSDFSWKDNWSRWYIHWHGLVKQKCHLHMMNMMQSKKNAF